MGEISINENMAAHIVPPAAGVVREVRANFGDQVEFGQILAVLDSREVGEAVMERSDALTVHELALADFERQELITTNTHTMLKVLAESDDSRKVAEAVQDLRIGSAKADLLEALTAKEMAQVAVTMAEKLFNYQKPIYANTITMLSLLDGNLTATEARKALGEVNIGVAKKEIIEALADVELATSSFTRQKRLLEQEVGSVKAMQEMQRDLDASVSSYEALLEQVRLDAEQAYLEAEQVYMTAKQEATAANATYPALLEQVVFDADAALLNTEQALHLVKQQLKIVEDKLKVLGLSHDDIQKLIDSQDERITYLPITAPFNGAIVEKHITVGELLGDDAGAFTIADLSTVWVNLGVKQKDLPYIRVGQPVRITADGGTRATGKIAYLSPIIDEHTRTALARLALKNRDNSWRPGLFVTAHIDAGDTPVAVLVPKDALQTIEGETIVFLKTGNGFKQAPVTPGRSDATHVEILSGLSAGQRYVAEGAFEIKAKIITSGLDPHAGHGH